MNVSSVFAVRPSTVTQAKGDYNCDPVRESICLDGVPTIPDDVHFLLSQGGSGGDPHKLPQPLAKRTNTAIRKACAEIQRRRAEIARSRNTAPIEADDCDDD